MTVDALIPWVNREFVGADAAKLARIAGLDIDPTTEMLIAEMLRMTSL